jgi:hypothetical protein
MKVKAAIKKVKSHFAKQGIEIDVSLVGHRWTFVHNGYVGSFLANGACTDEDQLDREACNFHVRRESDVSCPYSDYHAGSFRDNITQVCESLLPPPPKFPVGSLVRGKQNKRAIRQGYAGKVGLVMPSRGSSYTRVAWVGEAQPKWGWQTFPERDLELAT